MSNRNRRRRIAGREPAAMGLLERNFSLRALWLATISLLCGLAILFLPGRSYPQTVEQLVEQFFPQRLIDESEIDFRQGGPAPFRASEFVLADLDGVRKRNYIVAAYSNGFSGAILVLKQQNNTAVPVHEPNLRLLSGIFPGIQLIDINGDVKPEVAVSFSSARGPAFSWIFSWSGSELTLIGPSSTDEHGDVHTSIVDPDFVDIDGDGILDIVQGPADGPIPSGLEDSIPPESYRIYSFDGQKFRLSRSPSYFGTFFRQTGAPALKSARFRADLTEVPYLLKIVNGDGKGKDKVSSAEVQLNGVLVAGPERFNQQVREIVVPVKLDKSNVLSVELRGAPGGQITVTVEPQT